MLKTGFKSFIYSFSVSLFVIISTNKVFCHEKNTSSPDLNIRNKTIALYLTSTTPSRAPVKKITLSYLQDLEKLQTDTNHSPQEEVIVASTLEAMDIPLEFIDEQENSGKKSENAKQEIVLADVLYAPDHPLPMPEIKAEPIYMPDNNIEIKIASAPEYIAKETKVVYEEKETSSQTDGDKSPTKQEKTKDNSLLIARSSSLDKIPLAQAKSNNQISKVKLGNPDNLQHIALADTNISIQSMSSQNEIVKSENRTSDKTEKQKHLNDSPWVIAKSAGSKNAFIKDLSSSKVQDDVKDLIPLQENTKKVLLASETAKNLIIPIPQEILNEENITPRLAYPETSEDKQKEIDINKKIQAETKLKQADDENRKNLENKVLTPIDDNIDAADKTPPQQAKPDTKNEKIVEQVSETQPNKGFLNSLTSLFNKTNSTDLAKEKPTNEERHPAKPVRGKKKANSQPVTILPTEIRLSFQPNRAEISGQTLRWIQAFATKTAKTANLALEIRMDGTSSTALQQKRLNLLYNILTNKGVDYSMINTVFTSRDPNSFILRTISLKNNNNKGVNNQNTNRYIQW